MTFTDTVIRRIQRVEAERPVIGCGFDQPVGDCRGCYWLLERPAFKPWCQKFDHVAGKMPNCGDKMHIREDV